MFFDRAKVYIKAGDGGNGCIAMRREKFVPDGGPWGGDGGSGGNVVLVADEGLRTLVDFRYQRHYKAQRGVHGKGKNMHGASGEDLYLRVPVGTVVKDADTGNFIGDLTHHKQELVIAHGGRGGRGNARFVTLNNKAPKMAEKGEPGDELWLTMELKLLADVGLVGMPNAGKSSLISKLSAAKPKIADYPFTTIVPNLGMVRIDDGISFVVADIPGLIEGAHTGAGLGHEFLRHVERNKILVHLVDMSGFGERDPIADFYTINRELELYNEELMKKPMIVAANKMDMPDSEENLKRFMDKVGNKYLIVPISALTGEGLDVLKGEIVKLLKTIPVEESAVITEKEAVHTVQPRFSIEKTEGIFIITGKEIERHVAMTDLENEEALARLQKIMLVMGIDQALHDAGAKNGQTVKINDFEFEYSE